MKGDQDHPLHFGNGILRLCHVFPYRYRNMREMIDVFPDIKAQGFHAVWFSPLQVTGEAPMPMGDRYTGMVNGFSVKGSLYGVKDYHCVDKRFLDLSGEPDTLTYEQWLEHSDHWLRELALQAQRQGLAPLFDLVLNHAASDAVLVQTHPEWFLPPSQQYPDVRPFNYDDARVRCEIIEKLWRPYITRYIRQYGFQGARIDLAWHIQPDLRREVYKIIHELLGDHGIIVDEALYYGPSHQEIRDRMHIEGAACSTHITASTYWASPEQGGALPDWLQCEMGYKRSIVRCGCINFTGNHDELSLGGCVIEAMARERLRQHKTLERHYEAVGGDGRLDGAKKKAYQRQLLFSYVVEIEAALACGEIATSQAFSQRVREKIAIAAFTAKGWYMLSGDEYAEYGEASVKSVFRHAETNRDFYAYPPYLQWACLPTEIINPILQQMAEQALRQDDYASALYQKMDEDGRRRFLLPYIAAIKIKLNAGIFEVCQQFESVLQGTHVLPGEATPRELRRVPPQDFRNSVREANQILRALEAADSLSCDMLTLSLAPSLRVFVRHGSSTELVVVNIAPDSEVTFTHEHLSAAAHIYQARGRHPSRDYADEAVMTAKIFLGEGVVASPGLRNAVKLKELPPLRVNMTYFAAPSPPPPGAESARSATGSETFDQPPVLPVLRCARALFPQ